MSSTKDFRHTPALRYQDSPTHSYTEEYKVEFKSYKDDSSSECSTACSTSTQPYLDSSSDTTTDLHQQYPYYTALPAFDTPRKYSKRLRSLIESRRRPKPLQLTIVDEKRETLVHQPQDNENQYTIIAIDEKADPNSQLLGAPCDDEVETYQVPLSNNSYRRRRRNRSYIGIESEISWLTFAGMAAIAFMLLCSMSIFIAWLSGMFQSMHGLQMVSTSGQQNAGNTGAPRPPTWNEEYRKVLEGLDLEDMSVARKTKTTPKSQNVGPTTPNHKVQAISRRRARRSVERQI